MTDPRTVARAYFEAIADHDMDRATSLWQAGAIDHLYGIAELAAPSEIKQYFESLFAAAPDFALELLSVTAEGELVAAHWQMTGTMTGRGKVMGVSANGGAINLRGLDLLTVRDGKIIDNQAYTNGIVFARQLGVLPPQDSVFEQAMFAPFNLAAPALRGLRRRRG